ncbi:MAG: hypothetical protein JJU34_01110 [Lunatimonas sp.]|uniref:hypothetical protein n=1 Tax=Lunatimonas sp. TaxID=2060141 RepID=UPI00263BDE57|nr:hypothetical protein [Lunatimonas sp.]MCC5935855.1 hypothetical protein [Lunatimonas sp.]
MKRASKKNNTLTFLGLVFLLTVVSCESSKAQSFYKEKIPRENYFQAGFGPSFVYADNSGSVRRVDFNVRPSLSATYGRSINPHLDLRATLGYQFYKSREATYFNTVIVEQWADSNQAIESTSNIVFADIMPTVNLFKQEGHAYRNPINIYAGAGVGFLMAINRETMLKSAGSYVENKVRPSVYLPFRGGISYKLDLYSDLSLEGGFLVSLSDKLDGVQNYNRFTDILFQGQVVYRRYLSKFTGVY